MVILMKRKNYSITLKILPLNDSTIQLTKKTLHNAKKMTQ